MGRQRWALPGHLPARVSLLELLLPFLHCAVFSFPKGPGFPHFCSWKVSSQRDARIGGRWLSDICHQVQFCHTSGTLYMRPTWCSGTEGGLGHSLWAPSLSIGNHRTFTWDTGKLPKARPCLISLIPPTPQIKFLNSELNPSSLRGEQIGPAKK